MKSANGNNQMPTGTASCSEKSEFSDEQICAKDPVLFLSSVRRLPRKDAPALQGDEVTFARSELCPQHCQIVIERERSRGLEICDHRNE
jgi:hypothetical protein